MGYFSLVLHAHLPFVRHPEHPRFLEESWLYEAITETYVPVLKMLEGWRTDAVNARLTITLTPTLCSMLQDSLLQERYQRHLDELIELCKKEIVRTQWEPAFHKLALFYHQRLTEVREYYSACQRDLIAPFRAAQEVGQIEIITSAATHALLPLLQHPPSVRAQVETARDHYRACFGREPRGIWLPECAYNEEIESALCEAGIRWFILESHGILNADPQPRYALFAPLFTPRGLAAFGRDPDSARQVWSRQGGYPGHARYREFYRDIGFDLDLDYVKPYLPVADQRSFTGIKYYAVSGRADSKQVYDRPTAAQMADEHATHFLAARMEQIGKLAGIMDRPPLVVAPYDAELFGHWWYEGPEFLNYFVRKAAFDQRIFKLITPSDYLQLHPENQVASPGASSWGEEGYWRVWLNEKTEWIYPHLNIAQERMTELAQRFKQPTAQQRRMLKQAARELLLAQSSDWPFILRTGTSPEYAQSRLKNHLLRFSSLYEHLIEGKHLDEAWIQDLEARDNIFPDVKYEYWR
jgi:1,4-alpha-glucan branching enzyme